MLAVHPPGGQRVDRHCGQQTSYRGTFLPLAFVPCAPAT